MEPASRQSFQPAGAGFLLLAAIAAGVLVGLLIGWALGSGTLGGVVGLVCGIPLGVFVVYRRYRGYFT